MKKIIVQILLFVIIFNSIFNIIFGYSVNAGSDFTYTYENMQQANEEGTTSGKDNSKTDVNSADTQSTVAAIMGNLGSMIDAIPMTLTEIIIFTLGTFGYYDIMDDAGNVDSNVTLKYITIQNIVFGNYYMLNANIFIDSTHPLVSDAEGAPIASGNPIDIIKENVAEWYYILKLISLAIGLLTLIYIGIRMALSTVASDQAKYKKMLVAWVQSIGLILILPFIMRGLNYLGEILLDFAKVIRSGLIADGQESFELYICENLIKKLFEFGGVELVAYSITYMVLLIAQFKFCMMYLKRFFAVSFLTIISPLISITYSIDKAGDGRAQAFSSWLQEYTVNVLIQPLQAFIYLIFAFSANEIAKASPIVGVIFLLSLTRAEKIIKTIFNLRNMVSINTMRIFNKEK